MVMWHASEQIKYLIIYFDCFYFIIIYIEIIIINKYFLYTASYNSIIYI